MREYWKEQLNNSAADCYELIVIGLQALRETIDCRCAKPDEISDAYFAVYRDHPEFFYMNSSPFIAQEQTSIFGLFGSSNISTSIRTTNLYNKRTIDRCNDEINQIFKNISVTGSEFDIVLRCLETIVLNTEYEIDNQMNQNAASALCFHKAQCSGIAKAVKLLLDKFNIFCIVVEGQAASDADVMEPHAWNMVRVNNQYYHVDATYMLGANIDKHLPLDMKYVFYDDIKISKTHVWDHKSIPKCIDATVHRKLENNSYAQSEKIDNSLPINSYGSLYELRIALQEMITNHKSQIRFVVNIATGGTDELRRLITNSCESVFKKYPGTKYYVNITDGKEATVSVNR